MTHAHHDPILGGVSDIMNGEQLTNLQLWSSKVPSGVGTDIDGRWPGDKSQACDTCWYTCCCLREIELIPHGKYRGKDWPYDMNRIHFSVVVSGSVVHTGDPREHGAECGLGWWEMGDNAAAPKNFDKWDDGRWNDALSNHSAGRSARASAMASQSRAFLMARSSGGDAPLVMGLSDYPFNSRPFFRGWGDDKVLLYIEAMSGCSGCPDCCALILLDYSQEPISLHYRLGCGDGCGIPESLGGWRKGIRISVNGGNPMLIPVSNYDKPDVGRIFSNADRIGVVNAVDWSRFQWEPWIN